MKSKKIICLVLVFFMMSLIINIKSFAITEPELVITSNNYSVGNKMEYEDEKNVKVGRTLQLYAVIAHGNDLAVNNSDDLGWFVDEANLSGTTWTSSNTDIATVDNTGKVTGIAEGSTTITVTYNEKSANYEVTVKPNSDEENTGITFLRSIPVQAKILNEDYGFTISLVNIPNTEKENIRISIEDENIAKLTGIDLCRTEEGSGNGRIIANVKLLALGSTKITATLNYNGHTYSDTYDFDVVESKYWLSLSAKDSTDLPSSLEVNDKIQLTVMFHIYGGSVLPEDVTSEGVTYTSSDEKVAKVDDKGLITAIGEGTATITAEYGVGNEIITAKYDLKITDSTKSPANNEESSESKNSPEVLPKTGENTILIIVGIISALSISMVIRKKGKNYKE